MGKRQTEENHPKVKLLQKDTSSCNAIEPKTSVLKNDSSELSE